MKHYSSMMKTDM